MEDLLRHDQVRSILNGLAYSGNSTPSKCHINKINNRALFFGFEDGLRPYLDRLETLGEACHLGSGYWTTTPTRNIRLGKLWLIVSSLPTIHFSRAIKCKDNTGLGRISEAPFPNVITQDLHDWMRVPGLLESWITENISLAKENLVPSSLSPEEHEFFGPWIGANEKKPKIWVPPCSGGEVFLVRSLSQTPRHYFWGRLEGKSLLESNHLVNLKEIPRLRIGLEMLHRYSRRVLVTSKSNLITLKLDFELPEQEGRLLLAIASKSQQANVRQYIYSIDFESVVEIELSKLGIKFR